VVKDLKRNENKADSTFLAWTLNGNPHLFGWEALVGIKNHDGVRHVNICLSNECAVPRHSCVVNLELETRILGRHLNRETHAPVKLRITLCAVAVDVSSLLFIISCLIVTNKNGFDLNVSGRCAFWWLQAVSFPDDNSRFKIFTLRKYVQLGCWLSNSFLSRLDIYPHFDSSLYLHLLRVSQCSKLYFRPARSFTPFVQEFNFLFEKFIVNSSYIFLDSINLHSCLVDDTT
jgi:hypothetical protein